jgi:hypothetical protein
MFTHRSLNFLLSAGKSLTLCLAFSTCLLAALINSALASCQTSPLAALVRIIPDGEFTNGTGVVLTPDGYIVTARHVIDGYLDVFVKFYQHSVLHKAEVVSADNYLDIALLKVDLPRNERLLAPLTSGDNLTQSIPEFLCVGGYGINEIVDPVSRAISWKIDPVHFDNLVVRSNLYGFIFMEGQIKSGFSGGGAFHFDKLFGINLERGKFGSRILPFSKIRSFLIRNGLGIDATGQVTRLADLEDLVRQVQNNRGNIRKILTAVSWRAELVQGDLIVSYDRVLDLQEVVGVFLGTAYPIFDGAEFFEWLKNSGRPLGFEINGSITDDRMVFNNAESGITALRIRYWDEYHVDVRFKGLMEVRIEGFIRKLESDEKIGPILLKARGSITPP